MIITHSHYDAPFHGAVEDGSGCAQVLAQAWSWSKIPKEKRPKGISTAPLAQKPLPISINLTF